jgi:hypothetical protein
MISVLEKRPLSREQRRDEPEPKNIAINTNRLSLNILGWSGWRWGGTFRDGLDSMPDYLRLGLNYTCD